jgi:hypothetical protein
MAVHSDKRKWEKTFHVAYRSGEEEGQAMLTGHPLWQFHNWRSLNARLEAVLFHGGRYSIVQPF